MSVSGISKIMHCGMLITMPYCSSLTIVACTKNTEHFTYRMIVVVTLDTHSCRRITSGVAADWLTHIYICCGIIVIWCQPACRVRWHCQTKQKNIMKEWINCVYWDKCDLSKWSYFTTWNKVRKDQYKTNGYRTVRQSWMFQIISIHVLINGGHAWFPFVIARICIKKLITPHIPAAYLEKS